MYQPDQAVLAGRALQRAEALTVTCPYCYAGVGQRCFDRKTKIDIAKQPAHLARLRALINPQGV